MSPETRKNAWSRGGGERRERRSGRAEGGRAEIPIRPKERKNAPTQPPHRSAMVLLLCELPGEEDGERVDDGEAAVEFPARDVVVEVLRGTLVAIFTKRGKEWGKRNGGKKGCG
ncbi:hypothetical protein FA13DRAFT_1777721 [Coprinellus micaceus]|uniref:Uncharacterized protein n=1 Tax=Coprinellus micaceus TaxID=71717 RepID=A0A4Y7ST50_COPMI|nr:hypothetical protein FA13DRAFT_1777721 [Coprinellus micaceus]